MSRMSELSADLERLRPLAEACSQQPDTDATRKALRDLRDQAIRAGEALNDFEAERRHAAAVAQSRKIYANG